ncbi:hypothetical protein [Alkalicoccobacillus gibsonii]|uniref:hypothetical protein n=1 Tax=Alkalicoccobacillus gibsonii TaxID=79881 RepID=UPI0019315F1C|nr:hypothetical protein [Alkalicoccobacillus gibsonii]MBM0066303.1 hypothetical protein [Alkalicoccobacillus gibsonii]
MDNPKEKKYIVLPHSAYTKSLNAFKQGMQDGAEPKPKSRGAYIASSLGAAALLGFIIFTFLPVNDNQEQPADEENQVEKVEDVMEEKAVDFDEIDVNEELLSEVVERDQYTFSDVVQNDQYELSESSGGGDRPFHHDELQVLVPDGWELSRSNDAFANGTKTILTGFGGVQQTILIFDNEASQEEVNHARAELLSDIVYTKATEVPMDWLRYLFEEEHRLGIEFHFYSRYNNRFAIELDDTTKMYTLLNENDKRLYDYVEADLFGKKLILLTDINSTHSSKLASTYVTLSAITPSDLNDMVAAYGPYENKYGRRSSITILTGMPTYDFTELLLYEHELGFTSYLEEGTEVQKIERNGFTEWKFVHEKNGNNSYYSFGKLDPSVSIEDAKETLINGYEFDPQYVEGASHVSFYHILRQGQANEMLRTFELVQKQGNWYYIFTQADNREGFYSPKIGGLATKFQQEIMFH